jgi:hypothetical protein
MSKSDSYINKLKDPRWQKRRLEIMQRDNFCCQQCFLGTKTLHVHHKYYDHGKEPWDYPDKVLVTLCEDCHTSEGAGKQEAMQSIYRAFCDKGFLNWEITSLAGIIDAYIPVQKIWPVQVTELIELILCNNDFREMILQKFGEIRTAQLEAMEPMPY